MLNSKVNQNTRESYDNNYLCRLYKNGYKIRMALTRPSYETLSQMYDPIPIIPGSMPPPSGMHEIAAAHQSIAELKLAQYIKNHESFIEIGANAASFSKIATGKTNPHSCTLRSARDQGRHLKAACSNYIRGFRPNAEQLVGIQAGGVTHRQLFHDTQLLASGVPTETFCLNGWQNCDHQSQIAISNHSLYDISFKELAIGMNNHNTNLIRAFIHFPTEILDVDEWTSYEKGYHFKRDHKAGVVKFAWIGDSAFGYVHRYDDWIPYLTHGGFSTPFGFDVIIEKTAWHGSQFELTITKATAGGIFYSRIPSSLSDIVKVPNFRVLTANGLCKRRFNADDTNNYILTDGMKFRKLLDFINARAEKGFNLDTVKGYARTLVSEIKLGNMVIENRWHCTNTQFTDLCVSAFLLSAYQRKLDSYVINTAIEHMSKIHKRTLMEEVLVTVKEHLQEYFPHFHREDNVAAENTSNLFHRAAVCFFREHDSYVEFRELPHDLNVFFDYNIEEIPKIQPTANEIKSMVSNLKDGADEKTPEWALPFGIPSNTTLNPSNDYISEAQHDRLVQECRDGASKTDITALKTVLDIAANELIKKKPERLYLENMYALTGVPGGAKTGLVIDKIIPTSIVDGPVLIMCPTRALADKYQSGLTAPSLACTIHTALRHLKKQKWSLFIIDEAFTLPVAYINYIAMHGPTLIVGDENQIEHVDFSKLWSGTTMLKEFIQFIPRHHITETKRLPQDIITLPFIRKTYPGITSTSKQNASLEYVHKSYQNPQAVNICFTQAVKEHLKNFAIFRLTLSMRFKGKPSPALSFITMPHTLKNN
nr:nonstructural polyprotein [Eastern mosquitofish bastrovirus]